jgi:uncharacterized protein YndB with AHSA1/START domain
MNEPATETLSVVAEREVPYPPEKVWRALTQPHLIEEWLMKNDFKPDVGRRFNLSADWGAVDCQVLEVEPNKTLPYTWAAYDLESVVTWTLSPTSTGTHLRMEQSSFRPDQQQAYQGAKGGVAAVICEPGAGSGPDRLNGNRGGCGLSGCRDVEAGVQVVDELGHDPGVAAVDRLPDMRADDIGDAAEFSFERAFESHAESPPNAYESSGTSMGPKPLTEGLFH